MSEAKAADRITMSSTGVWSLVAVVLPFTLLAMLLHALLSLNWFHWNTQLFVFVGAVYLIITIAVHAAVLKLQAKGTSAVAALALPVTVRLLITFLLLVGLLASGAMGQNEAVLTVLFWYMTLTFLEVAAHVRQVKAMGSSSSARYETVARGI